MNKITKIQVTSRESKKSYVVNARVAETETFTAYSCAPEGTASDTHLLKIAKEPKHNALLDREAYILKLLFDESKKQEEAYQKAHPGSEVKMNYHLTFPMLVETFISIDQKWRRVLILHVGHAVQSLSELTPLINIERREGLRIDQRSSAWIMGKVLKALVFAHGVGIIVNNLSRNNILLQKEEHLVMIFDWSGAELTDETATKNPDDIAQLARAIIRAMGGDLERGTIPEDADSFVEYNNMLRRFALGKARSAQKAHEEFYSLVDKLWPREYYPFTTHPLR